MYFAWKQSPTTPTPEPVSAETAKAQKACRPGSPNSIGKAAFAGNIDRVTECLTLLKSDSDVKNNDGWTALHSAAAGGYKAVAQKLYGSGYFDLEAKNNQNQTPLYVSVYYAVNNDKSAVETAARLKHMIRYLRENQAQTNVVDSNGSSMLARAAGHPQILEALSPNQ